MRKNKEKINSLIRNIICVTVAISIVMLTFTGSKCVWAQGMSEQNTLNISGTPITIEEMWIDNNRNISLSIVYNDGLFEERSLIEGQYYQSISGNSDDKIVKIINNTSSNIVSVKFDDDVVKLYVFDSATGSLNGYVVEREKSHMSAQYFDSFENKIVESNLKPRNSLIIDTPSKDELLEIEYEWMKYVQPEIEVYEVNNALSNAESNINLFSGRLLNDIHNQFRLEAGFQDPLSNEVTTLYIEYQFDVLTYSHSITKREFKSSLKILGEYQIHPNNKRTYSSMLSLKNTFIEASLSDMSRNHAYITEAQAPSRLMNSGGVAVDFSYGFSVAGMGLSFTPYIRTEHTESSNLSIPADRSCKAIRTSSEGHLQRYNDCMVGLNIKFNSDSDVSLYGTIRLEPHVYLFGQTYIGSESHRMGFTIR